MSRRLYFFSILITTDILLQLVKFLLLKLLNGNGLLIRIGKYKDLIHCLQIVLDLVIGRTDQCLEAQTTDQLDTACHLLRIHLGKCLVQHYQTDGRILADCTDPLLLVFVGLLTGTGGGVLRDVLAGDMPYILRKHIYACASIVGGILYLLLRQVWQGPGAVLTGVLVVVGIRCAAAHFEWNLPRAKTVWKSDE